MYRVSPRHAKKGGVGVLISVQNRPAFNHPAL
jgi:hypothetical protein